MGPPPSPSSPKRGRGGLVWVTSALRELFKVKRTSFTESESVVNQFDVVNPFTPVTLAFGGKDKPLPPSPHTPSPRARLVTQPNTPSSPRTRLVRRTKSHAPIGEGIVGSKLNLEPSDKKKRREVFVLEGQTLPMAESSNHENYAKADLLHLFGTEVRYKPAAVPRRQAQVEPSRAGAFRVKRIPPPPVPLELAPGSYESDSTLTLVDDPFVAPMSHLHRRTEPTSAADYSATVPRAAPPNRRYGRI